MQAPGPEGQAPASRSTQQRSSELDSVSVSELVANRCRPDEDWARDADAQNAEAGAQDQSLQAPKLPGAEVRNIDDHVGGQCRAWTGEGQAGTVVEAAAAVATAAVATAAELKAIQEAEVEQETREEADWVSHLARPQDLQSPAVSANKTISETGNDTPELSVMDSKPDCLFEGAASSTSGTGAALTPQPAGFGITCVSSVQEVVEHTQDDPAPELQMIEDELDEVY